MITITEIAADKIKEILKIEGVPTHALRVVATDGGCCGPSYEIMIDEATGDGDTVVEKNGARVFVDASTAKTLEGAELNFVNDEHGSGFVLGFPGGTQDGNCSCGDDADKPTGGCSSGGCGCR